MSDRQWYKEYQDELKAEQHGKSRQAIAEELLQTNDNVFDPETAPKKVHRWVDRGLKMSCEGAGHPHHQSWKRTPM